MGVMEWISVIVALVTGAATGGVVVGFLRSNIHHMERRVSALERRVDGLYNGNRSQHS